jgi:endonuclease III
MQIEKVFTILEESHQPTMLELMKENTPFQKLIATLLSARTKDKTTIPIVKKMFLQYPEPQDYLTLDVKKLEKMIYGVGFFRVKAKHVKVLCRILVDKYAGKVPESLDELTSLPGVGRKTANCVLNYAFGKSVIAVDIHVHRISNRLGWIKTKNPEESEFALMEMVPKELWIKVNELLVGHGQTICKPINPSCGECGVKKYCEFDKTHLR